MRFKTPDYHSVRCIKNVKMYFILVLTLAVSQISVSSASDLHQSSKYSQLDLQKLSSQVEVKNSDNEEINPLAATDPNVEVEQKIDALRIRIAKFIEAIKNEMSVGLDSQGESNNCTSNFNSQYATSGSSLPPDVDQRVKDLENEIKRMKEEIEELKQSSAIDTSAIEKLAHLEKTLNDLFDFIGTVSNALRCRIDELKKFLSILSSELAGFAIDLREIKEKVIEIEKQQKQRRLRKLVVESVKGRNYVDALEYLQQLDGDLKDNIYAIVQEVMNFNMANFKLILPLGDTSLNTTISLAVYQAIYFEMDVIESNDESTYYNLVLQLIRSLQINVINRLKSASKELEEATTLRNKLRDVAKDKMIPELRSFLENRNYNKVSEMFDEIDRYYPSLFKDVFKPALESAKFLETPLLVNFFKTHKHKDQTIIGCSITFFYLKGLNVSDDTTYAITLAFIVKRLLPECRSCTEASEEAKRMKAALPSSVRNLAFSNRVCLYNVRNGEYMYAAGDGFKYDSDRRSVFSWGPKNQVSQGDWVIEPLSDDVFLIKNTAFNEYLYAASFFYNVWNERRYVFTWARGGWDSDQFKWTFMLKGAGICIRNAHYREFLFADDQKKYDDDRRYVFTWEEGRTTADSVFTVVNCG